MRIFRPASFAPIAPPTPDAGSSAIYSNNNSMPRLTLGGVNAVPVPGKIRKTPGNVISPGQNVFVGEFELAAPAGRWAFNVTINYGTTFGSGDNFVRWGLYTATEANKPWISTLTTWSEGTQVANRWDSATPNLVEAWVSTSGQDNFVACEGIVEFTAANSLRVSCNTNWGGTPTVTIYASSSSHIMPIA
ncbi:hypothetical protein [Streptosporangium sp. NPDC048865]|uniref:hypothetical protein n=1 Tax=Streptosporangium sp. NPDC048865 TaxID=3155766 RepID=UPI003434B8EB